MHDFDIRNTRVDYCDCGCDSEQQLPANSPHLLQYRSDTPIKQARYDRKTEHGAIARCRRRLQSRPRGILSDQDRRSSKRIEWIRRDLRLRPCGAIYQTAGIDNAEIDRSFAPETSRFGQVGRGQYL